MTSNLIVTDVEQIQNELINIVTQVQKKPSVYISLNKTQKSTEEILRNANIQTEHIFFIDCVTKEKVREDVLHISPQDLDTLSLAVKEFIKDIKGEKFIIIDALSTLLIYNNENKVAQFIQDITSIGAQEQVHIFALSPKTRGEELLNKIFNFFDHVQEK